MELSKGNKKASCVDKGKGKEIVAHQVLDGDLEKTVKLLREKNVGVVIRDERELNQIRMHGEKENAKAMAICEGKENVAPTVNGALELSNGKGKASYVVKGKEIAVHHVAPNDNVISKRMLAQRLRRERERAGEYIQPIRPTFFGCFSELNKRAKV